MTSLKILAAAALVAFAAPAVASESGNTFTIQTRVIEFLAQGSNARMIEGRNSGGVFQTNKVQAATSQGFAPVDTDAALRGTR